MARNLIFTIDERDVENIRKKRVLNKFGRGYDEVIATIEVYDRDRTIESIQRVFKRFPKKTSVEEIVDWAKRNKCNGRLTINIDRKDIEGYAVDSFIVGDKKITLRKMIRCIARLEGKYITIIYRDLNIIARGLTRSEAIENFHNEFLMIWEQYGKENRNPKDFNELFKYREVDYLEDDKNDKGIELKLREFRNKLKNIIDKVEDLTPEEIKELEEKKEERRFRKNPFES